MRTVVFLSISRHVDLILNRLRCDAQLSEITKEQQENRDRKTETGADDKKRADDHREYIEHRLREIASWERKINGGSK